MADSWNIDTVHSQITFTVRHMVFAKVRGKFGKWSGALQLDPQDLGKSKVEVAIDASSIDTSEAQRDGHLKLEAGGVLVGTKVDIDIDLQAVKQKPS